MRKSARDAAQPVGALARRWEELHDTAAQLATLAQIAPEPANAEISAFPGLLGNASDWQRELAWQGMADIDAMMRPGLAALRTLTERGQDASAPALALWREFHAARSAVLFAVQPQTQAESLEAL